MFTWVCPTCGRELDVATKDCPNCSGQQPAADAPPAPPEPPQRPAMQPPAPAPPPVTPPRSPLWIGGAAALAVVLALSTWFLLRGRSAERRGGLLLETPGAAAVEDLPVPPAFASIEIAGIRPFYDDRNRAQVRAVIINHAERETEDLALSVALRPRQAPPGSPPLARFQVKIPVLKPGASREIQVPLEAFGTLAALPGWRDLRADFE
jgi:hypothetical protein